MRHSRTQSKKNAKNNCLHDLLHDCITNTPSPIDAGRVLAGYGMDKEEREGHGISTGMIPLHSRIEGQMGDFVVALDDYAD